MAEFFRIKIGRNGKKKIPVLKNRKKETGIIRAAAGTKEVNVITATSAREVLVHLLLFMR